MACVCGEVWRGLHATGMNRVWGGTVFSAVSAGLRTETCVAEVCKGPCGMWIGCLGVCSRVCASLYGERGAPYGAAARPPTSLIPALGHPRGHKGFRAALCPPRSHPQSLAWAGALAHLPRAVQIWDRGFSLINRLQLIVLSAKGV